MALNQGATANKQGNWLTKSICEILENRGFVQVEKKTNKNVLSIRSQFQIDGQPRFAREVAVGKSIYGHDRKCDIFLIHEQVAPKGLIIQCKWQATSGSVDEKFGTEVLNIQEDGKRHDLSTILVLDGGGFKEEAKKWFKSQAGANNLSVFKLENIANLGDLEIAAEIRRQSQENRLLQVLSIGEATNYINKTFK